MDELKDKIAEAYMKEVQGRFKYKKFYNNETGEISNQQHITSLVEDYWFSNRGARNWWRGNGGLAMISPAHWVKECIQGYDLMKTARIYQRVRARACKGRP